MSSTNALDYKVEKLSNVAGIFYENLGHAKFYSSQWKMITYLNISMYYEKLDLINKTYELSRGLCSRIEDKSNLYYCTQSLSYYQIQIPNLYQKAESVKDLIGHTRQKRGWFNAIGSLFKTIFGTLDSNDAQYYDSVIDQVNKDDKTLYDLMKSQIQVVKSTIANFNETVKNFKIAEKQINLNIDAFNEYNRKENILINKLITAEAINEHLMLLTFLVNDLNEQFDNFINAILFAKKNIIHPSIITPIQLITEINENKFKIENGLTFPIETSLENAHTLIDISELTVYYMNGKLIFIIQIPLSDDNLFILYHLIPLPVPHNDQAKSFAYIQPNYKFVALSENKLNYVQINEIDDCKILTKDNYLCKGNMYYSISQKQNCEISFLISKPKVIPENCNTKLMLGNIEIYHKLKYNQWISINSEKKLMTIMCKGKDKIIDESLSGTNLITLNETCKAYTDSILLKPDNYITFEYQVFIPTANIIEDDCCQKGKLNFTHEYMILNPITLSNVNLDELKLTSHTLDQMNDKINEAQNHPKLIRYPSIFTIIIYSLIGIVGIALLIYCCKCFKRCKNIFKRSSNNDSNCIVKIFNQCCPRSRRNQRNQNYEVTYRTREGFTDDEEELHSIELPAIEIQQPRRARIEYSNKKAITQGKTYNVNN